MIEIKSGDCRDILPTLPAGSVQCCVTSPPYWGLRDYGTAEWEGGDERCDHKQFANLRSSGLRNDAQTRGGECIQTNNGGRIYEAEKRTIGLPYLDVCGKCGARRIDAQLGLESTPQEYIANMVAVFREVKRVLRDDGTCWINLGSSYASGDKLPNRSLVGVPAYDSGDKVRSDYPLPDSFYPDLCDGCRAVLNRRNSDISQQISRVSLSPASTIRDREHQDFGLVIGPREEPCVPASTMNGSFQQPPAECSHCANCGACLSVLRSSSRDASLCARRSVYKNDTTLIKQPLVDRISGRELSSLAHLYSAIRDYKSKDLVNMPFWLAEALRLDGWYLRSEIVWHKPNPMPESVTDRPTKAHEMIYLLAKRQSYFYDAAAIREKASEDAHAQGPNGGPRQIKVSRHNTHPDVGEFGQPDHGLDSMPLSLFRNKRSVWTIPTQPYSQAHFATFPEEIPKLCILAGSRPSDTVLDPFAGSGTVGQVALELGRRAILIELSGAYAQLARQRTNVTPGFCFPSERSGVHVELVF